MIACLVALIAAVFAAEPLADPAIVVEAEKRFAAAGWECGIRSSFMDFLADDSIVFVVRCLENHSGRSKENDDAGGKEEIIPDQACGPQAASTG